METIVTTKGVVLALGTFVGYFSMLYPPLYHLWSDLKKKRYSGR